MKSHPIFLFPLAVSLVHADSRTSANYSILADIADSGGQRTTSANYTQDGSTGTVSDISTAAASAETVKHGYLGQIFDITGLVISSTVPTVNETEKLPLSAWHLLDDSTLLALDSSLLSWEVLAGPVTEISAGGIATTDIVYQDTLASVQGDYAAFTAPLDFSVLDSIADNFGSYAGDGVGDGWQVQYFGQDNPLAAPGLDADGDGQTNAFEYIAGVDPTDAQSHFTLSFHAVPGLPGQWSLVFGPRLEDRIYQVICSSDLVTGWQPLTASTTVDDGLERTVTDTSAMDGRKFYHVEITKP